MRPAELGVRQVSVEPFLERIVAQSSKLFVGVRIEFRKEGLDGVSVVMDRALMEQALGNIVANAAQDCGHDGNVTLSSKTTHGYWDLDPDAREPLLPGGTGEREDFLTVSVRDDGPGIPEEIRDKIFVPFFTTNEVARPGFLVSSAAAADASRMTSPPNTQCRAVWETQHLVVIDDTPPL